MKIRMELKSDAIFGNGSSIPGGEDISVLSDNYGFPFYKGGTFKGVFREELFHYLMWTGNDESQAQTKVAQLLGKSGDDTLADNGKIVFSDFCLSDTVKAYVLSEIGDRNSQAVLDAFTNLRIFTSIEEGMASDGSLRMARCVNKGICLYSKVKCDKDDQELVENTLKMVKWIGTMRNRGFGKVQITVIEQGETE